MRINKLKYFVISDTEILWASYAQMFDFFWRGCFPSKNPVHNLKYRSIQTLRVYRNFNQISQFYVHRGNPSLETLQSIVNRDIFKKTTSSVFILFQNIQQIAVTFKACESQGDLRKFLPTCPDVALSKAFISAKYTFMSLFSISDLFGVALHREVHLSPFTQSL